MQYLLSEEEYQSLRKQAAAGAKAEGKVVINLSTKKLQALCTKIANEMPVKWGWGQTPDPKPWGCMLTAADDGMEWYCDTCPVKDICPNPNKDWSK